MCVCVYHMYSINTPERRVKGTKKMYLRKKTFNTHKLNKVLYLHINSFICLGILFSWCLFVVCLETGAHYVAQASLELRRDPFAAASQALGRKLCATTSSTVLLVLFALEALCSQGLPQSHYSPQDGLKS